MRSLLFFHAIISFVVLAKQINGDIIDNTCMGTPIYQLCVDILRKDPGSSTADTTGLALIMVKALEVRTTITLAKIQELKKTMPELKDQLSQCDEDYSVVLNYDITEAYEALYKGNAKFAETGVADAAAEANGCENQFESTKSPLSEENKLQADIANVARQIIRKLL